jgi:hypothetical protein
MATILDQSQAALAPPHELIEKEEDNNISPSSPSEISSSLTPPNEAVSIDTDTNFLTGAKLLVVVASVTIVTFLMLLDIVIIVTVSS